MALKVQVPWTSPKSWPKPQPRRPPLAGPGRHRKIAMLGGARTLKFAPWHDPTWELWAHASCRQKCQREPDVYFDLHPPELFRDPKKKFWDVNYLAWAKQNHVPIYMQDKYEDIPASLRYPFETMITEFPRGYMTNTVTYMVALALMEGVTHMALYGCHYESDGEYGPQRGSMEYWCGVAEGRGVHVLLPPMCDLLNKPSLLYGYQSHPNGVRDKSYMFLLGPKDKTSLRVERPKPPKPGDKFDASGLVPADAPDAPPLMNHGQPPATERRPGTTWRVTETLADVDARLRAQKAAAPAQ